MYKVIFAAVIAAGIIAAPLPVLMKLAAAQTELAKKAATKEAKPKKSRRPA
jgi:hypothetical protein